MNVNISVVLFFILIPLGLSILLLFLLKRIDKIKQLFLTGNFLFPALIVWILLGFFLELDFNERCGCGISQTSIFEIEPIIYSSISFILILLSWFYKKIRPSLFVIETIFWLSKLLFLKAGYAVSVEGIPVVIILSYDLFGLLIRIWILAKIIRLINVGIVSTHLIVGVFLFIKLSIFPCQIDLIKHRLITPIFTQSLITKISGEWEGTAKWRVIITDEIETEKQAQKQVIHRIFPDIDTINGNIQNLDTFYLHSVFISSYIEDDFVVTNLNTKVNVVFNEESIVVNGLSAVSNKKLDLKYIESRREPFIFYGTEVIRINEPRKDRNVNCVDLKIVELNDEKLIGTINGIIDIELIKKN